MFKLTKLGRVSVCLVLCLAVLAAGLPVAEARMVDKAAGAQTLNLDELTQGQSADDLALLAGGMTDSQFWWLMAGVAAVVVAGVVVAIIIWA
jgi:hypothetical protein